MIEMVLFGIGMLIVTIMLQFFLFKKKKSLSFWSGTEPVFIMCILGLISTDVSYLAGILGYIIGDDIGKLAGWDKYNNKSK